MANNNCNEFRKNQSINKNQTIELLNQFYQYINNTTPNSIFIEVENIINTLKSLYKNDPSSFKMAPETYIGLERLKEMFPESHELCEKIWNQTPVFSSFTPDDKESAYTSNSSSPSFDEDEIYE